MSEDNELLEAAARAVNKGSWHPLTHSKPWNPLEDDGDALRLAVALGISLDRAANRCWAFAAGMAINGVCEEFYRDDANAATRRAIVRAAAAVAQEAAE